jgi:hypothetical protein
MKVWCGNLLSIGQRSRCLSFDAACRRFSRCFTYRSAINNYQGFWIILAVATQIANPAHIAEAMARVAIIAPDVDDALNVIARALYLHQPVTRRWFVSPPSAALLLICLIYLVCIAAPVAELELPTELQGLLTNEVSYIALAITLASMVIDHNRRS